LAERAALYLRAREALARRVRCFAHGRRPHRNGARRTHGSRAPRNGSRSESDHLPRPGGGRNLYGLAGGGDCGYLNSNLPNPWIATAVKHRDDFDSILKSAIEHALYFGNEFNPQPSPLLFVPVKCFVEFGFGLCP